MTTFVFELQTRQIRAGKTQACQYQKISHSHLGRREAPPAKLLAMISLREIQWFVTVTQLGSIIISEQMGRFCFNGTIYI